MLRITDVVKHLLIINILVFIISKMLNADMLALRYPAAPDFQPLQLATYFFMHASLGHIFFNMFALVMFGSALETLWGPKRFLFFYFFCAIGAAIVHWLYNYYDFSHMQQIIDTFKANPGYETYWAFFGDIPRGSLTEEGKKMIDEVGTLIAKPNADLVAGATQMMESYMKAKMSVPTVGASGAIYGLLLAFGMYFPRAELMLIFLPIPVQARYFIPVLMLIELFLGVNQFSWDNIAHFAHLGGAISGFLLILYWRKFGSPMS